MEDLEYGLPRIHLLGTSVNRGLQVCPTPPSILAMRRSVGEVDDACAEGLRVHELQHLLLAPVLEEALAAAHHDGMDHKPQFVQEVLGQQRPYQGRAAGDRDVFARLPLEFAEPLGEAPFE